MEGKLTKIAQIGAGYWGKNLVRNFAELGVLAAIVDPNTNLAKAIGEEFDVPIREFADVLADTSIDGISIATPAQTHAEFTMRSLGAGKHVFVEKPLALRADDARALQGKARGTQLCLMVGHLLQYHPIFMRLSELIRAGKVGRVHQIYSNRMSMGKFRLEENVWWSFAPHDLSMILAIAGGDLKYIEAQGACHIAPGIADWVTAQMKFSNGVCAHLNISWLHPFKEHRLAVIGEKGSLVFEDSIPEWEKKLTFFPHKILASKRQAAIPVKSEAEQISVERGEPLRNECLHFLECIRDGLQPRTDVEEGLRVLNALSAGQEKLDAYMRPKE